MKAMLISTILVAGCGVFSTENARKVQDVHRELCDVFVAEQAEEAGISLEEAIKLGWETSCMLNVGSALNDTEASTRNPE